MNNLLWLLSEMTDNSSLFEQLHTITKPHESKRSFKFKFFNNDNFEEFLCAQPFEAFLIPKEKKNDSES